VARPLVLVNYNLNCYNFFNFVRRVPGVRRASVSEPVRAGGAPRKNFSIEGVLADSRAFVPEEKWPAYEAFLRNKYY
ncbi:MAG TPA: hypothetical protein HA233_04310, partial [Nanoarchaeota archaeon]|nr:hypothetical protein [Nanoarchaeota archaeon]